MLSLLIYLFVRLKKKNKFILIKIDFFKVFVFVKTQADQINPDIEIKNCTLGELCTGAINSNFVHYYSVEYLFDPNMVRD
jgi:hypothetical protein